MKKIYKGNTKYLHSMLYVIKYMRSSIYAADTTMGGIVKDANDFLQEGLSRDNPLNPPVL